jgi:uncharacterized protein (DUF1800 family)
MECKNLKALAGGFLISSFIIGLSVGLSAVASIAPQLSERQQILHVLNRLGYGPGPGDVERVEAMGLNKYVQQQLHPQSLAYPDELQKSLDALQTRQLTPIELYQQFGPSLQKQAQQLRKEAGKTPEQSALLKELQEKRRRVVLESSEARLLRVLNSPRQLEEVMTDFWFNHFNVYAGKGTTYVWIGNYEDHAIRPYVFGRFRDLLEANAKHPAMLFYLDNWLNTSPGSSGARGRFTGLNENYARELLELHTLGVDGGYTQKDVTELARVLTGWGIVNQRRQDSSRNELSQGFFFDANRHDFGTKVILGKTIQGTGLSEIETVLDLLARHPATAKHISFELAQAFVSDNPPESLVNRLTQQYIASDGNIRSMLQLIFNSTEFHAPAAYRSKFKTPYQYIVSMMRVAGITTVDNPLFIQGLLKKEGMPLYGCQSPTGYKNTMEAWLSPDAMTQRTNLATGFAAGKLPVSTQRLDIQTLLQTFGVSPSPQLETALKESPPQLQAALFLGSPDFMKY